MTDKNMKTQNIKNLCKALLLVDEENEMYDFLKDLCTPAELAALSERWEICKALNEGKSYREIATEINVSLTTIGRVARFLKDEPYQGYSRILKKMGK